MLPYALTLSRTGQCNNPISQRGCEERVLVVFRGLWHGIGTRPKIRNCSGASHDHHVADRSGRPGAASDLNNPKLRSGSVLDGSVRLNGDLWSEGDVQIDGHLCGTISCVQLIVSKDAVVMVSSSRKRLSYAAGQMASSAP